MRGAWRTWAAGALLAAAASALAQPGTGVAEMRLAITAERVAKLHAQLGHGVLPQRTRRAMAQAVRDVDGLVAALRAGSTSTGSAEQREQAMLLAVLWRDCRPWALKPPGRESHRQLGERVDEIAWVAWKAARLARAAPQGSADARLDAARAAALAQRVARLHLARQWAADPRALDGEAAARARELAALVPSAGEGESGDGDVAMARSQLEFLAGAAQAVHQPQAPRERWEFLAKSADHVSESLERAALGSAAAR